MSRASKIKYAMVAGVCLWTALIAFSLGIGLFYEYGARQSVLENPNLRIGAVEASHLPIKTTQWFDGAHSIVQFSVDPQAGINYLWNLGNGQLASGHTVFGVYLQGGNYVVQLEGSRNGNVEFQGLSNVETSSTPLETVYSVSGMRIGKESKLSSTVRRSAYSGSDKKASGSSKSNTASLASSNTEMEAVSLALRASGPSQESLPISDFGRGKEDTPGSIYLNVPSIGGMFTIEGEIKTFKGSDGLEQSLESKGTVGTYHVWQAKLAGFMLIVNEIGREYHVFVSPVPSKHVDRPDINWYLTQYNTKTTSNCGPSVTAMAIRWAKGTQTQVIDVRQLIGWQGIGAITIKDMQNSLDYYGVSWQQRTLNSPADIFDVIDRGHLLAVSYDMAGVAMAQNPQKDLIGQHYKDKGGHYIAIKGYSLDRKYFIVYDSIPSDWGYNSARYGDGVSMIGRNRYFPVDQLWTALRSRFSLEILP